MLSGGRLLGQGVYGCAFDPPLKCKKTIKKSKAHQIGKILNQKDAKQELEISNHLQKSPYANDYFVLFDDSCTPQPRAKQTDPDLRKCDMLEKGNLSTMKQLLMPYGGIPLYSVPMNPKSIDFFAIAQQLLEAGSILLERGIAHTDLHGANLLLQKRNRIMIIDYGIAKILSKLEPDYYQNMRGDFSPGTYRQITPEFLYMLGIADRLPESLVFARLAEEHITFQLREALFSLSRKKQEMEFQRFVSQSRAAQAKNLDALIHTYWSKQDAWSIGTILLIHYKDLLMNHEFVESSEYRQKGEVLERVLKGLTEPDPGKRLDCAEALEEFNPESKILQVPGVRSWIQEQKQIRLDLEKLL